MQRKHTALVTDGVNPQTVNLLRPRFEVVDSTTRRWHQRVDVVFGTFSRLSDVELVNAYKQQHPKALLVVVNADGSQIPAGICSLSSSAFTSDLKALLLLLEYEELSRSARRRVLALSWSLPALFLIASVVIWQLVTQQYGIPVYVLPAPVQIGRALFRGASIFLADTLVTMMESLGGFAVGSLLAFIVGAAMVHSRLLERAVYPYAIALKTIPLIAIAPLLVLWMGNGYASKVTMSALICFFPVLVNTIEGLRSPPTEALAMMRSLAATRWQIFVQLRLPLALPYLFAGLKISTSLSVIGSVVAELSGSKDGIGHAILLYSGQGDTEKVFAGVMVISAASLLFFGMISLLEQIVTKGTRHWRIV